jgi:hypothetical protein
MTVAKRSSADQVEFMRNLLAFLLVGSFIAVVPLFVFKAIPKDSKEVVVYMIGQLSGMATTALGFYFVSKVGQDALDAKRSDNTAKALDAITATAKAGSSNGSAAGEAAQETADAAQEQADEIANGTQKPETP